MCCGGQVRGVTKNVDTVTVRSLATGQEVSAIGYLGWGLPGIIQSRTFNEYVRRSRWWGQAKVCANWLFFFCSRLAYATGRNGQYRDLTYA
jgi:hypothetical protein